MHVGQAFLLGQEQSRARMTGALFVGQWPAAFLLMGVYDKMVTQHGSDAYSRAA